MRRLTSISAATLAFAIVTVIALPGHATAGPVPAEDTGSEHVTIMRSNGDGTTSFRVLNFRAGTAHTFATPAGWTKQSSSAAVSAAAICKYGETVGLGDNTAIWPCYRWGFAGHSDPQVYFRDHTPAEWPVSQAVADWNQTVGIDSYWMWHTTPCPNPYTTGKHCVNVYAGPYGTGNLSAWTDYSIDDRSNRFIDGTVAVYFNTSYYHGGANDHRSTACEELGHALGVGHNFRESEGSCMNMSTGTVPLSDLRPGTNDRGLLTYVIYPD